MNAFFSVRRALAVARVETLELIRDPAALCLILLLPLLQIMLYGYAINPIHDNAKLALAGDADTAVSQVADWAKTSPALHLIGPPGQPGAAEAAVKEGKASIGLEMDSGPFGLVSFKVFADGSDPATTRPALAALETAYWRATQTLQNGEAPAEPPVTWLFNPKQIGSWSIVPGLVGVIVMISMLFLGAMVLVRERERGTWEGLLATPVRPGEALVGKLAPYLVVGVGQTAALIWLIHALFQVPAPFAQALALVGASILLSGAYLILGFALSAITQNQLQAVQASVGVYLPSLLLSGFLFPFQTMPAWAQDIGRLLPLTYYIRATRDLLVRGDAVSTLAADLWPIALFGLASLIVALLAYRRRLD